MRTEEILAGLQRRSGSGRCVMYPLWECVVCVLYDLGYLRRYICDAFDTSYNQISYAVRLCKTHLEIGDRLVSDVYNELRKHNIRLVPRFEMTGKGGVSEIKTDLYIDNKKFERQ